MSKRAGCHKWVEISARAHMRCQACGLVYLRVEALTRAGAMSKTPLRFLIDASGTVQRPGTKHMPPCEPGLRLPSRSAGASTWTDNATD